LFYDEAILHAKDGYLFRTDQLSGGSHIKKRSFVDPGSLVAGNRLVAFDDEKRQCFAVDSDSDIFFGGTPWTGRAFCQHSLSRVGAVERMFSTQSRAACNRKTEPRSRC